MLLGNLKKKIQRKYIKLSSRATYKNFKNSQSTHDKSFRRKHHHSEYVYMLQIPDTYETKSRYQTLTCEKRYQLWFQSQMFLIVTNKIDKFAFDTFFHILIFWVYLRFRENYLWPWYNFICHAVDVHRYFYYITLEEIVFSLTQSLIKMPWTEKYVCHYRSDRIRTNFVQGKVY